MEAGLVIRRSVKASVSKNFANINFIYLISSVLRRSFLPLPKQSKNLHPSSNGVDLFEYELKACVFFAKFKTCYQENICIYRLYSRYAGCNLDTCANYTGIQWIRANRRPFSR